jgi:hypothetical protein
VIHQAGFLLAFTFSVVYGKRQKKRMVAESMKKEKVS